MDHCIVYVSNSTELLQEVDLATILLQSRRDNYRAGITGVLLCLHGQIIQVLEGKKDAIDALYDRIKQDQRHTNVTTLINHPIGHRLFASWSMGYQTLTSSRLEEISVVVKLDNDADKLLRDGDSILYMVKAFYDENLDNYAI